MPAQSKQVERLGSTACLLGRFFHTRAVMLASSPELTYLLPCLLHLLRPVHPFPPPYSRPSW